LPLDSWIYAGCLRLRNKGHAAIIDRLNRVLSVAEIEPGWTIGRVHAAARGCYLKSMNRIVAYTSWAGLGLALLIVMVKTIELYGN
jgi:hypothetical protein